MTEIKNPPTLRQKIGRFRRQFRSKPKPRWGQDFVTEYAERTGRSPSVIFDVGGFIGLAALEYSDAFPNAKVYTFEPTMESFTKMQEVLVGKPNIVRKKLAFGAESGHVDFAYNPEHPSMSRISDAEGAVTERVEIVTLDQIAAQLDVAEVDILKIDTEGHEMNVLAGAKALLTEGRIGILILECGLRDDSFHVSFCDIYAHLGKFGYRVFGFYEQWEDTLEHSIELRRSDVAFISPKIWKSI